MDWRFSVEILISVFDLKAVRGAVDFAFDTFMPKNDFYSMMNPQSRNDVYSIIIDENESPEDAAALEKVKAEIDLRSSITVLIGGLMNKQECWEKAACFTGIKMRQIPGNEIFLP